MKYLFFASLICSTTLLFAQTENSTNFCITENSTAKVSPPANQATNSMSSSTCPKYIVRVYFHFIKMDGNPGYSVSNISALMGYLNNTFDSYGISFVNAGDRNWYSDTWGNPNTPVTVFGDGTSIFSDPNLSPQSNAVNLYDLQHGWKHSAPHAGLYL